MTPQDLAREAYFASRHLPYALQEDARQEAMVGMLQALERFDPERGASEVTFVAKRARGAVMDWARRCDPLTRQHRSKVKAGESLDISFVPLADLIPVLCTGEASPLALVLQSQVRAALLARLMPKEAEVLLRLFWEEQTCGEVAKAMRRSIPWVSKLRAAAICKLRAHFVVPQ